MRDKMSQLKGEIGEKTSWDSKYCSELFNRRWLLFLSPKFSLPFHTPSLSILSVETLHFLVRSVDSNYKTFLKEKKHKSERDTFCQACTELHWLMFTNTPSPAGMSTHGQKVHDFTKWATIKSLCIDANLPPLSVHNMSNSPYCIICMSKWTT